MLFKITKFGECSAKKTFLNFGLNGRVKCAFLTENWPYLGNGKR